MAQQKLMRLSQAAIKLNIGIKTLVDHLNSKGIKVETDPNAQITPEQFAQLLADFGQKTDKFCIKSVWIKNFALQESDIAWELFPDVNFLVGDNGSGKSTLLNMLSEILKENEEDIDQNEFRFIDEMLINLAPYDYIRFDAEGRASYPSDILKKIQFQKINSFEGEEKITHTLIHDFKANYFKYYSSLMDELNQFLSEKQNETMNLGEIRNQVFGKFILFVQFLNDLFEQTDKFFVEKEFAFRKKNKAELILPENLSSGEKQAFLLLLTCLLQKEQPAILLLDEPEISMHIEWQEEIIRIMRELNPNCQIIVVTHSPNIYMKYWRDRKKGMYDIEKDRKIVNYQEILDKIIAKEVLSNKKNTFNYYKTTLKQTETVNEGIEMIKNMPKSVLLDIIFFSILLGKTRTQEEIDEIEELRQEMRIPMNETYKNKLKAKR